MKLELFREDHSGVDRKPFATVASFAEAEGEAIAEIEDGDAEAVVVRNPETHKYEGTVYVMRSRTDCACCGAVLIPGEKGIAMWGIAGHADDTHYDFFCTHACVEKRNASLEWTNPDNGFKRRLIARKVGIDNFYGPDGLDAWIVEDEHWNGFVIPYFTKAQADEWLRKAQENFASSAFDFGEDGRGYAYYDAMKDEYTCVFPESIEDPENVFSGHDWINPQGETVRLYCIGGWNWTWEDQTEPETRSGF
jgi:hypothetical protein